MKIKLFLTVCAVCTLQFADAQKGLWFGSGPDTVFTNRHVKIKRTLSVLEKLVAKEILAERMQARKITADTLEISGNVKLQGAVSADSIRVQRILPAEGDSIIRFGSNTVFLNLAANRISWTPLFPFFGACGPSTVIGGLSVGNGPIIAYGANSMAFGTNTSTGCAAANAIVMGTGIANNLANTFQLGFGNTAVYADATRVGIFTTAPTHVFDVNGDVRIRNVQPATPPNSILVGLNQTGPADVSVRRLDFTGSVNDVLLGNGNFGPLTAITGPGAPWVLGGNPNATAASILGTTSPGIPLNIWAAAAMRMNIDPNGNVGVGTNYISNAQLLDVDGGNIDVNTPANAYMIADQRVLWHNGGTNNIMVGVDAGASMPVNSFLQCAFVGNKAGFANIGFANTFIGFEAGLDNYLGDGNAFYGYRAGRSNSPISASPLGSGNSFFGSNSGTQNTTGSLNTFIGNASGTGNISGIGNTLLGSAANVNTAITTPDYAAAIGYGAIVTDDYKFILGDNNTWTGIGLSNDLSANLGPQNSLEINARSLGTGAVIPNKSGLRFRQLTSASPPAITTNGLVLTVDAMGDVILAQDQSAAGAAVCPAIQTNFVTKWTGTDLCNSQIFDNAINLGIGTTVPSGKLTVINTNAFAGILTSTNLSSSSPTLGVFSEASGSTSDNYSGRFDAIGSTGRNIGVLGVAQNGPSGNIAIWGIAQQNQDYGGYFIGNVAIEGNLQFPSDAILKENIRDLDSALYLINLLQPRVFNFKTTAYPQMGLPQGKQFGLVAQETENIIPEIITNNLSPSQKDSNGNTISFDLNYKSIEYTSLIPILVQAIKEQQVQITALQNQNSKTIGSSIPSTDMELASATSILWQNFPNPFGDGTVIRYFVPENSTAAMKFYDEFGNEIKTVELPHKGTNAELNIAASNLTSGIYSYSLVVNGKIAGTKTMLKTK